MKVLTEAMLRSSKAFQNNVHNIEDGMYITPDAKLYASEHDIYLHKNTCDEMKTMAVRVSANPSFIDAESGKHYTNKPENMTHLHDYVLVKKSHPRIHFRGKLDLIQAEIIDLQILASKQNREELLKELSELLQVFRKILAAEVKEEPLAPITLFNMDEEKIHDISHNIQDNFSIKHPIPDYHMGEICAKLNLLRTKIRQVELAAIEAFESGNGEDIIRALNRMSSAVYILFCKEVKIMNNRMEKPDTDEMLIRQIVQQVIADSQTISGPVTAAARIPLEVSARHVHLTDESFKKLFGEGAALNKVKELTQTGEFLSDKRVKLVSKKGEIANAAVLGPLRKAVQVELSQTDCRGLGLKAPLNISGDLKNAADILIIGDVGAYEAKQSVIVAKAHIHMQPDDAKGFGVNDGQVVSVRFKSVRPITLENVVVRVRDDFKLACHIDFDEANASSADNNTAVEIVGLGVNRPADNANKQLPCEAFTKTIACECKLITEAIAKDLAKNKGKLYFRKGTIITPSGRDIFNGAGVQTEFI